MSVKKEDEGTITSRQMRAFEQNAEYFGVPRLLMMENAGYSIALEVSKRFKANKSVLVFCGLGGNGGDGFVAARHLASMGFKVTIIVAGKGEQITDKAALTNWKALQFLKETIQIFEAYDSTLIPEISADVIIDALLGTGTKGTLKPPILQMARKINSTKAFKVAVDIPTGVDADTGKILGTAVKANLTITFYKAKPGLEKAKKHVGQLLVKDIGVPREFERYAGPGDVTSIIKTRPSESHKGDYGRLLVVGGSETFSGAPALVALSSLRTGVDLVYVAAPEKTAQAISAISADLITIKLDGEHLNPSNVAGLKAYVEKVDAVVLGPGLGTHRETEEATVALVRLIEDCGKSLLLDADGLKAFAKTARRLKTPLVLTPHAGEYAILTGERSPEDLDKRVEHVRKTAEKLNAVVLLKGATDIISDGKRIKLNFTGNPGMTVGGTGDVLSGIVGAFLAQKADPFEAAVAGAFVNGAAGDFVFAKKGYHMTATDLIDQIPKVLNNPMRHLLVRRNT
ncbi:MAG: NAD(P)H-hydrate dehydratase [Candidatus Bathyarchaeia archaeon]